MGVLADEFMRALQQFERTSEVCLLVGLFHEDGEVVNLGRPVESKGVTVLEFEAGLIRRCRTYYDSAVFMSGGATTEG